MQSTVNRASKLLGDNISKDEKISQLKQIARETVDIQRYRYVYTWPNKKKFRSGKE